MVCLHGYFQPGIFFLPQRKTGSIYLEIPIWKGIEEFQHSALLRETFYFHRFAAASPGRD